MHYPDRSTVCVSSQAGCAMALRVLRHRPGRLHPPSPARARSSSRSWRRPGEAATTAGLQRRVHGHGRAAGQLRPGLGGHRAPARRPRLLGPPSHPLDGRRRARHPAAGRPSPCRSTSPSRCTPPTTHLRDRLVPINRRYPLDELDGRLPRTTWRPRAGGCRFEWALIDGVNDRPRDAAELAALVRPLGAHVNLIPLNPTPGYPTRGTPPAGVRRLPGPADRSRGQRHGPAQPGDGHRRRLRSARRSRRAGAGRRRPVVDRPPPRFTRIGAKLKPCLPTVGSTGPSRRRCYIAVILLYINAAFGLSWPAFSAIATCSSSASARSAPATGSPTRRSGATRSASSWPSSPARA